MKEFPAFQDKVVSLLKRRKYDKIFRILKGPSIGSENIWNIIKLVYETAGQSLLTSENDVRNCEHILTMLMEKGNPNKMLLALLEQTDWFKTDEFFCLLLKPLQTIFKKIPGKRGKSLLWVLTALNSHIESHDALAFWQKVGELRTIFFGGFRNDKLSILSEYLDFLEYFVDEVSFEKLKTREIYYYDRIYNQQEMLQNFILKLFDHPFLYFDIEEEKLLKETLTVQVLCEKGINMLSKICRNVFNLFDNCNLNKNKKQISYNVSVPLLAFSNLSYLTFVGEMTLAFQPFVYTHNFIFQSQLKYIIPLLKQEESIVVSKGLQLTAMLLDRLDDEELNYECMDLELFAEFSKLLCDITVGADEEERSKDQKAAYQTILNFADRLDVLGQYNLVMLLLSFVKQPNIIACMVVLYRKNVEIGLEGCDCKYRKLFFGKSLAVFLRKTCVLGKDFENSFFSHGEKMEEILNFLKILFEQDAKSQNLSGVWDNVQFISKKFLRPLSDVVEVRKTQLKTVVEEYHMDQKNLRNATKSGNQSIPTESKALCLQKSGLKTAITRLKCIEQVIAELKILIAQ